MLCKRKKGLNEEKDVWKDVYLGVSNTYFYNMAFDSMFEEDYHD